MKYIIIYGRGDDVTPKAVPLKLDSKRFLHVRVYDHLFVENVPIAVPTSALGALYTNSTSDAQILRAVRVVNTTAGGITLKLKIGSDWWGIVGAAVAANSYWEWSGYWPLAASGVLNGLAGGAGLEAQVSLQYGIGVEA